MISSFRQHTRVVSTVNGAVLGAAFTVRAVFSAPGVACVAVGVSTDVVGPSPVGIEHNRLRSARACATRASRYRQAWVRFGSQCACLLSRNGACEHKSNEDGEAEHLGEPCDCLEPGCRLELCSECRVVYMRRGRYRKRFYPLVSAS